MVLEAGIPFSAVVPSWASTRPEWLEALTFAGKDTARLASLIETLLRAFTDATVEEAWGTASVTQKRAALCEACHTVIAATLPDAANKLKLMHIVGDLENAFIPQHLWQLPKGTACGIPRILEFDDDGPDFVARERCWALDQHLMWCRAQIVGMRRVPPRSAGLVEYKVHFGGCKKVWDVWYPRDSGKLVPDHAAQSKAGDATICSLPVSSAPLSALYSTAVVGAHKTKHRRAAAAADEEGAWEDREEQGDDKDTDWEPSEDAVTVTFGRSDGRARLWTMPPARNAGSRAAVQLQGKEAAAPPLGSTCVGLNDTIAAGDELVTLDRDKIWTTSKVLDLRYAAKNTHVLRTVRVLFTSSESAQQGRTEWISLSRGRLRLTAAASLSRGRTPTLIPALHEQGSCSSAAPLPSTSDGSSSSAAQKRTAEW